MIDGHKYTTRGSLIYGRTMDQKRPYTYSVRLGRIVAIVSYGFICVMVVRTFICYKLQIERQGEQAAKTALVARNGVHL